MVCVGADSLGPAKSSLAEGTLASATRQQRQLARRRGLALPQPRRSRARRRRPRHPWPWWRARRCARRRPHPHGPPRRARRPGPRRVCRPRGGAAELGAAVSPVLSLRTRRSRSAPPLRPRATRRGRSDIRLVRPAPRRAPHCWAWPGLAGPGRAVGRTGRLHPLSPSLPPARLAPSSSLLPSRRPGRGRSRYTFIDPRGPTAMRAGIKGVSAGPPRRAYLLPSDAADALLVAAGCRYAILARTCLAGAVRAAAERGRAPR